MSRTTTPTLQGREITEYCGIVVGEAILGANIIKDIFGAIRDIDRAHSWLGAKPAGVLL